MGGIADMFKKPKTPDPVRMPDPEDTTVLEAKRRERSRMAAGGRTSTNLSGSGTQGGSAAGTYTETLLG